MPTRRPYELPTGWEEFPAHLLRSKLDEINALAAKVTEATLDEPADEETPESVSGLDYAESLATAKSSVSERLTEVTEADEADRARRESVLADLAAPEPAPEPDPEPVAETDEADEVEETDEEEDDAVTEVVEAEVVEETVEETTQPVVAEAAPEAPAVEAVEEQPTQTEQSEERELVGATASHRPASESLRAMNSRRSPDEAPRPAAAPTSGRMRAIGSMTADGWQPGDFMEDLDGLSEYFSQRLRNLSGSWDGPRTKIPLVQSIVDFDDETRLAPSDIEHNYGVFARNERTYQDMQMEALTAAGAPCAPLMPSYEFETCYSVQRPVETGLPVVGAPRGGIRFLDQVPLDGESAGAITTKDATAAALVPGDGGYAVKNCTRVSCPTETEITVAVVSWCVLFDNLGYRVFPEQVRNMLQRVAIEYAKAKEIYYLNRIDTLAGAAVNIATAQAAEVPAVTNPFGAGRSLFADLAMAAHNYRKRNNMSRDAILDVWLPDAVEETLAIDMVNDPNMSAVGTIQTGPNGNLLSVIAQRARLNVNWYYYDSTNGGFPASAHNGAAATWNFLPSVVRSYMHAPGALQRLDAGQLDLGVVRDSTLNADNDLQLFAEQWIEVAKPGCEVVAYDHTVCHSGVGPSHVTAPGCP